MNNNNETNPVILLPYDFSEVSKYAVKHAGGLAKAFGYSIMLLNIMDENTRLYMRMSKMKKPDLEFKMKETATFIKSLTEVETNYMLRRSDIKSIPKITDELNVSFVVIGIDEPRSGATPILKAMSKSPRPVLVVQQRSEYTDYKKILFPLDDFHSSRQKAPHALRIAKVMGAHIHIFSMNLSQVADKFRHKKIIEQTQEYFKKHGAVNDLEFSKGKRDEYAKEIIEASVTGKCDLIIIMHRPKKLFRSIDPIDKALIFNVARIPVMCVNPRDLGVGGGIA